MSAASVPATVTRGRRTRYPAFLREIFLLIVTVIAYLLAGLLVQEGLFRTAGIEATLQEAAILVIITVGQAIVILGRGLDLSVAPIMGFGAAVTGSMANEHGLPIIVAALLAIALGAVFGMVNGLLVVVARIPAIIATLATFSAYGGLLFLYLLSASLRGTTDNTVNRVPENYSSFAGDSLVSFFRWPVVIAILIVLVAHAVLTLTRYGRSIYVVGGNPEAARTEGLRVDLLRFSTYVISGVLAAVAGFLWVAYTGYADSETGTGTSIELLSIAAVLVGGVSIAGGRGTVLGAAAAAVFITVVGTLVVVLKAPPIWQAGVAGVLLLVAVWLDAHLRERRARRGLAPAPAEGAAHAG